MHKRNCLQAFFVLFSLLYAPLVWGYKPENKPDNAWSRIKKPLPLAPEPIGSYANGCMIGAKELAASGNGFVDMRRNRNRYYGQPRLIEFIQSLGQHTYDKYQRKHLIGDLSQPRGGRMNFGHSSHQIGLDVDIWMQTIDYRASVNPYRDMKTIVNKATGVIIGGKIDQATRDALYFSAQYPRVARIFVNPVVKKYLCQTESDTRWLSKIRPWWGHDQHFHVRLSCPPESEYCRNQKPVPPDDGCNDSLSDWVNEQIDRVTKPKESAPAQGIKIIRKKTPKVMPALCTDVRTQQ